MKKCSETCEEYYQNDESVSTKDIKYIDQYNLSCVECNTTSFKYFFGGYCLENCNTEDNRHQYYIYDTGECVSDCSVKGEDYLLLKEDKICIKECPSYPEKKFRDDINKECNSSKVAPSINLLEPLTKNGDL